MIEAIGITTIGIAAMGALTFLVVGTSFREMDALVYIGTFLLIIVALCAIMLLAF
jgi:hypothetical protein